MKTLRSTLIFALSANLAACIPAETTEDDSEMLDIDDGPGGEEDVAEATAAVTGAEYPVSLRTGTGYCVDVKDGSTADGAGAQAWHCNGALNQAFIPILPDGTSRAIVAGDEIQLMARHTDKCLDVYGGFTTPETPIIQWACHAGNNQRWIAEDAGGGAMRLRSKSSNLCMAAETTMWGALVWQQVCDSADTKQRLTFQPTNAPPRPPAGTTVTIYRDVNYEGPAITFSQDIPNLDFWTWANFDNYASSVKVSSGGLVTLYRDPNYGGPCETVWFDTPDMYQRLLGNDSVSSLRIGSYCPTVVLYQDYNYSGISRSASTTDNLADIGFDNRVTSMTVSPGMTVSAYTSANYSGSCASFSGGLSHTGSTLLGNDTLSSFRFGSHCNTRQVTLKNNAAMNVRFRLKRDGLWSEYSDTIMAGQTKTLPFTQYAPLELSVEYQDFAWATGEPFCDEPLDSSRSREITVWGATLGHGCTYD